MTGGGGFIGTFGLLANVVSAMMAFVSFPKAYDVSWPWLFEEVLVHYGPALQEWSPWIWSAFLALFLFATTRALLLLLISASGVAVALRMIFRNRRD